MINPLDGGSYTLGKTDYDDPAVTISAVGSWDDDEGISGDTPSGWLELPLIAKVRYPSDTNGYNVPFSSRQSSYPLVLVMHGRHGSLPSNHEGYTDLISNLATHGIIAVSINANPLADIDGRQDTYANVILSHITHLLTKNLVSDMFRGKIDFTRIALVGHSRGGEGVVKAGIFVNEVWGQFGFQVKAIVSLAPTDFSGTSPDPLVIRNSKFLCMYGTNDGDVYAGRHSSSSFLGSGFRIYDRAEVEKSMIFIEGATHNRFNTEWGTEGLVDISSPKILSDVQHRLLLRGYVTAFMQTHLLDMSEQHEFFTKSLALPGLNTIKSHFQYQPDLRTIIDNFEGNIDIGQNTLGGSVDATDVQIDENELGELDVHSPHQTRGLILEWNGNTGNYHTVIPTGLDQNIADFKYLSFRISRTVENNVQPINSQKYDFSVKLHTDVGDSRSLRVCNYGGIPESYKPEWADWFTNNYPDSEDNLKTAALKTIRIPLQSFYPQNPFLFLWRFLRFVFNLFGFTKDPPKDPTKILGISFKFDQSTPGAVLIDDIELTE